MNITLTELLKQRPDAEWAAAIGVTERAVAAWRYGARVPSPKIAIQAAKAAGIPVCRANGNSGTNPPNGTDAEIQTASVHSGLTASGFSNYGSTTDLAAIPAGAVVERTVTS